MPTLLQTSIHSLDQILRQRIPKLINILPIDINLLPQRNIHDLVIQEEEILRNLRSPRIRRIQRRDKSRGFASRVELEMDGTLRENSPLKSGQIGGDLRRESARSGVREESILEHEARLEGSVDDGEPFRSARVGVRAVHAAGVEDCDGGGDSLFDEDGEVVLISEDEEAAFSLRLDFLVEVEDCAVAEGGWVEDLLAETVDCEELVEAVDVCDVGEDFFGEGGVGGCGGGCGGSVGWAC